MIAFVVSAIVLWLVLGLLAVCACVVGGRAEAAREARLREEELAKQERHTSARTRGMRAAML
jgi:hypothetical protein